MQCLLPRSVAVRRSDIRIRCRNLCTQGGFTLVEVVVGMVLLATLLVGILQAYGAHHRQLRLARDQIVATQIADEMLSAWRLSPEELPIRAAGPILQQPGWSWQTQPILRRTVAGLPVDVVRLNILSFAETPARPRLLCSVDVVRPVDPADAGRVP